MKWDYSPVLAAGIIAGLASVSQQALALNLGSLVYEPVEPCRIVDTRSSVNGNLQSLVPQSFVASGAAGALTAQGGNPSGCEHPKSAEGLAPVAISANIAAVAGQATANGDMVAYPTGSAQPTATVINFYRGTNLSNSTIIPLCEGDTCTGDFDMLARFATIPVVVDVQGYFYPKNLENIVKVSPAGGDFATIIDAMAFLQGLIDNSDPDAPAEGNAYIVEVGPGVYDGQVTMVPYVTIRGAGGTCATTITYTGGAATESTAAAVITADQAFLESVCIEATNPTSTVIGGIYVPAGGGGSSVTQIYDVSVSVDGTGAADAYGVIAGTGSQLDLGLSQVNVAGATTVNDGVTASSGVRASVMTTEITAGDIALGLLGGLPQTAKGNQIDGNVILIGTEPRLINNLITGAVSDGDTGTTNCQGNYDGALADTPPGGC